ncbi:MAG: ISL3 family transposase [Cyanosarcina radialis HA8281-LM2]|jgi:transposase|nr:ISL3 family transposase [Cyanosarcina radialis HA8281-LM2]
MPSNSLLHFLTKIIKFAGFKVTNYHFITENELLIELENQATLSTCPHCHKTTDKVHQSHRYRIRDIPWSSWDIFLSVDRRQFRCQKCHQVFSEELNFVKKRRTYTKRLAEKVLKEVLETDVVNTGIRNRLSPAEIETILKEAEADLLNEKPTNLKKLGIDEITHLKGGKNYAAVLVDLVQRKPIALLEKRNKSVIAQYLLGLGSEILNQIEEVSIDLWIPYKSVIEELMPQSQVVADRFHVMKQINDELDRRRKTEKRQAEKLKNKSDREPKLAEIKNSKYPLLKQREKLNKQEKEKLEEVKKVAPDLIDAYYQKEKLRDIFESPITGDEAFWHLVEWTASSYQYFPASCQTIKRWIDEILAYFDNRTTQGAVEGINQKIKLIKRRAYGLTNFDNFRRRVLLNWAFC